MRLIFTLTLLASLFAVPKPPQGTMGLPLRAPVYCIGGSCTYPFILPNVTLMAVCRQCEAVPPTDNRGDIWTQDQCNGYDGGDCIYSTHPNVPYETGNIIVSFPKGEGSEIFLLMYSGNWVFDQGNFGTYDTENSGYPVSAGCVNGGNCSYNWTKPVEVDAGELLIAWNNENGSGSFIAVPGFGFTVEGNSGHFAVEDMIAPISSTYVGSMQWNDQTGYLNGGSHWLMGVAAYAKK